MSQGKKHTHGTIAQRLLDSPMRTSITALAILAVSTVSIALVYYKGNYQEYMIMLLEELHGLVFDLAIIGILIFWLFRRGEKRRNTREYQEEIDDFRTWESEEAAFKTVGNIKRLNRLKVYDIDLSHCYLARTNLNHARLTEANLNYANCSNAFLIDVHFEGARLNQTNFENSNLNQSVFRGAYAGGSIFRDAYLIKTDFESASLIRANFENAFLMEANLQKADLTEASFNNCNLYKADLRGVTGLSIDQLAKAKTLYLTMFDEDLLSHLKGRYPELIGK
jgi:hypothetical protein